MLFTNAEIINRLASLIHNSGLNSKQFAYEIGLTESGFSAIMHRRVNKLSSGALRGLESALSVNVKWLAKGRGKMYIEPVLDASPKAKIVLINYRKFTSQEQESLTLIMQDVQTMQNRGTNEKDN
ncbi:MAG: hypothetical protein ABUK01_12945 [Leptospirales bacterium]